MKKIIVTGFIVLIGLCMMFINCCRYPEVYIPSAKIHLYNDLKNGDEQALEYYQENYLDNNIKLFEEDFLND